MKWFEVDKQGLARILERRGKAFAVLELLQNAWDQDTTTVDITISKEPNERYATITVADQDPRGFSNLSHAFTLFADSEKKSKAHKRGRFNLGEKLVLALCEEATILSTTGGYRFDSLGRHSLRNRREAGSVFSGKIKMTNEDISATIATLNTLIPPLNVKTRVLVTTPELGRVSFEIEMRSPLVSFYVPLRTEIADAEGNLRPTTRHAEVAVYEPREGETGTLYEMGIPVVETGDRYHVDVHQKVPVNLDRDNVPPAYLRTIRALVMNRVHDRLDTEQAAERWVNDALGHRDVTEEAVRSIITKRFGDRAVAFDPSDQEANRIATSEGYTVVYGASLPGDAWANVRAAGALRPAGQVTPSPKPFTPGGRPLKVIERDDWSAWHKRVADGIERLHEAAGLGYVLHVTIANDRDWPFNAAYAKGRLTINQAKLGLDFFSRIVHDGFDQDALDLLIHEFGHYFGGHLSEDFDRGMSKIGARLILAIAKDPGLLRV